MTGEFLASIPLRAIAIALVSVAITGLTVGIAIRRDATPGQSNKVAVFVGSLSMFVTASLVAATVVSLGTAVASADPYGAVVASGTLVVLYAVVAFLMFIVGTIGSPGSSSSRRSSSR